MSLFLFQGLSNLKIESLTLQIVRAVQPSCLTAKEPFDIVRFFDNELEDITGVAPDYRDDLPPEIFGITDTHQNLAIINSSLFDEDYGGGNLLLHSTLAHEAAHCILHVPQLKKIKNDRRFEQTKNDSVRLYRGSDIPLYRNPEWQAWRFAGALLMPAQAATKLYKQASSIQEMARFFRVSRNFMETRLRALEKMNLL